MSIDYSKLAFTSDLRYMRCPDDLKGSVTVTPTASQSVTHGLGFVPLIDLSVVLPDGTRNPIYNIFTNANTASSDTYFVEQQEMECTVVVSTTQVTFSVFDNTFGGRSVTFYYRVLDEEIP